MNDRKTINIPARLAKLGNFQPNEPLCVHTGENALVILPQRMTAMQAVQAIDAMSTLSAEIIGALEDACDQCVGCPDGCPFEGEEEPDVELSGAVLHDLGIPRDHKYCVEVEKGKIHVSDAGYAHDISDVPADMREMLAGAGVCLGHLDELLMREEIVYEG